MAKKSSISGGWKYPISFDHSLFSFFFPKYKGFFFFGGGGGTIATGILQSKRLGVEQPASQQTSRSSSMITSQIITHPLSPKSKSAVKEALQGQTEQGEVMESLALMVVGGYIHKFAKIL